MGVSRETTIRAKSRWTAYLFLDHSSVYSTNIDFCPFSDRIVTPNSCIQMQFSLPTPCFNAALNRGVRASMIWINIENGERGKSLVIHLSGPTLLALIVKVPTAMKLERGSWASWSQTTYPTTARPRSGAAAEAGRMDRQERFKILGLS